ncbi:MAG: hypothetical protein M1819_002593 [Sarea resinae]|nr:MAG: hypothetical protein M1819_002593 [Sarea resinae]
MAAADVQSAPVDEQAPAVPDYLSSPNAVLGDTADWRYGRAPNYSNTRAVYERTKRMSHQAGSLPQLVENLVKNWEIEASFKKNLSDWRTVDHDKYTFAVNGGVPQSAQHMLNVGTYNAVLSPNQYYSPEHSDFAKSHKTFKRMMPTFPWEVMEVYSGPPKVAFKWRHWGTMKNDYVSFNDVGEKVTVKAHGGPIDIEGITIAQVDDQTRLQAIETWFDPMEMFRQIAPNGIINKTVVPVNSSQDDTPAETAQEAKEAETQSLETMGTAVPVDKPMAVEPTTITDDVANDTTTDATANSTTIKPTDAEVSKAGAGVLDGNDADAAAAAIAARSAASGNDMTMADAITDAIGHGYVLVPPTTNNGSTSTTAVGDVSTEIGGNTTAPAETIITATAAANKELVSHPEENAHIADAGSSETPSEETLSVGAPGEHVMPGPGSAVVAKPDSEETRAAHEQMAKLTPMMCPFLMNKE